MARPRRPKRNRDAVSQLPWQLPRRVCPPIQIMSADQVETVHQASLSILRDTGIHFFSKKARDFLERQHGVTVDTATEIVKFEPEMVEQTLTTIPRCVRIHARNPEHDVVIGEDRFCFTNTITPPYASDLDRGRRAGTKADFCELLKLCQSLNAVHMLYGYPVEPQDLPPETRHLDAYASHIELTDKIWRGYSLGDDRIRDAITMARIARGLSWEEFVNEPSLVVNVTTNSPLSMDEPMAEGLMLTAEARQPISVSAFTMAGAMAPITLSGALAQQNAEILCGAVFTQLVSAGAPVIYGAFTTNVNMRSGAVAFGNPEFIKATMASGQLARRYGMPYKAAVTTCANAVDAQAAYETQGSLWGAVMGGGNVIAHGAGFFESGLTTSYEKLIVDVEMLQMMMSIMTPIKYDEDSLAVETVNQVGPGGHFFDSPHTLARYEHAFYEPLVSDWSNHESWVEKGSQTADQRANTLWKKILGNYSPPPLDEGIKEELDEYVERRRREISTA